MSNAPLSASPLVSGLAQRLAPWLAALGGFGWFLWLGGGAVLPPTHLDWMMREDWAGNVSGWLFFRNAPWGLPLGATPNQFYPYGTSVALTDGNPWAAVLLKPFSSWLPLDFQYTGVWFALCFLGMGYFGARVVAIVSSRAVLQVLGGVLLALSPVIVVRFVHPTLCAHWLLVAMLWLHLRAYPDPRAAWRALALAAVLNVLSAGTHPYWVAMLLPLTLALAVRLGLAHALGWGRLAAAMGVVLGLDLLCFALFGYFVGTGLGAEGYGQFSSDLTTLVNPMGWSQWLQEQPVRPRQWEGFGYLGAGGLWLLSVAGLSLVAHGDTARRLPWRRGGPALGVVGVMAVYALSDHITWRGRLLVDLSALSAPVQQYTAAFRSSGRFIWPLYYLLLAGAVVLVVRLWRERPAVAGVALGLAVALQAGELRVERSALRQPTHFQRLSAPEWASLRGTYQHLSLFPTQAQWVCHYDEPLVSALVYLAYREGLTFNSGYASRTPPVIAEDCRATMRPGGVEARTVYVVMPDRLEGFLRAGARCGVLENLSVCVAGERTDAFAQALDRRPLTLTPPPAGG